jgi:hypothetical protein
MDRSDLREMTADAASEHTKRHAVGDGS